MSTFEPSDSSLEVVASRWLARRDRGLSAVEQDEYLQWLREHPSHGAEIARLERTWALLNALAKWQPEHSAAPNPDLLAPSKKSRRWMWPTVLSAVAAAVAIGFFAWNQELASPVAAEKRTALILPGPNRMDLADGSLVELNGGAKIDVDFNPGTRLVRLTNGEAHFTVAKDVRRPFVVKVDGFTVRAVGTAFAVETKVDRLSVLVTEGTVQLDEVKTSGDEAVRSLSQLTVGQEAVVRRARSANAQAQVEVRELSPTEIDQRLAWQSLRLEFVDLPLRDVVEEFNRYNTRKLVIEDKATGDIVVGGSFRADNWDSFVRLLDVGFNVGAENRGQETVLLKRR